MRDEVGGHSDVRSLPALVLVRYGRPSVLRRRRQNERRGTKRETKRQIVGITGDNETEGERATDGRNAKDREGIGERRYKLGQSQRTVISLEMP